MLVICDGMPRSASTWSFNVVLALLRCSQPGCEVYSGYDENIAHFLDSVPSTATHTVDSVPSTATHTVLKCHELDAHGRALTQSGTAKAIYTWRDPADVVISCMRMFDYDFESSLSIADSSLELYHFHQQRKDALILDYGQIVSTSIKAIWQIAVFLGIDSHSNTIEAIAEQTSLERVKKDAELLTNGASLVHRSSFEHNPETLLHRGHVRNGSIGYGRKALTANQSEQIDALLRKHEFAAR